MEISNLKSQISNAKQELNKRLVRFSLDSINICQEARKDRNILVIADQLIRSATSVGANVIEAKSASSKKEYVRYYEIALKSANETTYWLILLRESSPVLKVKVEKLLTESQEISKILGSSIITIKRNNFEI